VGRVAAVLVLACCLAAAAAAAPAPSLVVQGDRVLAGVRILAPRAAIEARLGAPDSARRTGMYTCRLVWRRLGLTMLLIDLSEGRPCRAGLFQSATIASRRWRTTKGLRVGSTIAQLRNLYPAARFRDPGFAPYRGWWLVPRRTCVEVGAQPYPGLLARVARGRVTALVMLVTACE
jgi:hypothetical protein